MPTVTGLYAIVDLPHARGLRVDDVVGAVLAGGCRCLQLRAKETEARARADLARAIAPRCAQADAQLWINDDLELALALGDAATGVHLGQEDLAALPDGWRERLHTAGRGLGVSTHDLSQLERAHRLAPTYVGFGPIFPTTGKANPDPVVGIDGLRGARARATVPVVAIGGIDHTRVGACLEAGASAVALIGALVADDAGGIEAKTRTLHEICEAALATRAPGAIDCPH